MTHPQPVAVAVTHLDDDLQVGAGERKRGRRRQRASVQRVHALHVEEVGAVAVAADAPHHGELVLLPAELGERALERLPHPEVAATRAPGRLDRRCELLDLRHQRASFGRDDRSGVSEFDVRAEHAVDGRVDLLGREGPPVGAVQPVARLAQAVLADEPLELAGRVALDRRASASSARGTRQPARAGKGQTVTSWSMLTRDPIGLEPLHRLAHRHLGAAEQQDRDVGVARSVLDGRRHELARRVHACAAASRSGRRAWPRLSARPAVLVVLVAVHELKRALDARQRARRDAGFGDCVALRSRVTSPSVTSSPRSIDHGRSCRTAAASDGCPRGSVSPRMMTGVCSWSARLNACQVSSNASVVVAGREDDARELALRGVDGEAQVGLLGPRGQARSPVPVA